jgi:tetratricopeptide (TPR) repeat protein
VGVIDDLALSGVDRVERSLGKRAALRALVPLLDSLPAGPGLARGVLRAIAYAGELDEIGTLHGLTAKWAAISHGAASEARALIAELLGMRKPRAALELARAEVDRTRGGDEETAAQYALGRALEASGELRPALAAYEDAARRSPHRPRLTQAASVREVRVLAKLTERDEAARRASRLLPLEKGATEDRLALAVIALDAPGRYARAAAIDVLAAVARSGGELGRAAVRWAAWHAERSGAALSEIEADRIEAVLALWPDTSAARNAVERLRAIASMPEGDTAIARAAHADKDSEALLSRGRMLLERAAPGPRPTGERAILGWLGLSAIHAVRAGEAREALEALRELSSRIRNGARVEAPAWTAALTSMREERLVDAAAALLAVLLTREMEPPPRGFGSVAEALDLTGRHELAMVAWRKAASRREAGARERLASILCHRGWKAAQRGARDEAIQLLREARRLAGAER